MAIYFLMRNEPYFHMRNVTKMKAGLPINIAYQSILARSQFNYEFSFLKFYDMGSTSLNFILENL